MESRILVQAAQGLSAAVCAFRDEGIHDIDLYNLLPLEEETLCGYCCKRNIRTCISAERLIFTRAEAWYTSDNALHPAFAEIHDLLTLQDLSRHYGCGLLTSYTPLYASAAPLLPSGLAFVCLTSVILLRCLQIQIGLIVVGTAGLYSFSSFCTINENTLEHRCCSDCVSFGFPPLQNGGHHGG